MEEAEPFFLCPSFRIIENSSPSVNNLAKSGKPPAMPVTATPEDVDRGARKGVVTIAKVE